MQISWNYTHNWCTALKQVLGIQFLYPKLYALSCHMSHWSWYLPATWFFSLLLCLYIFVSFVIFPADVLYILPSPNFKSLQFISLVLSQCPKFRSIQREAPNDSIYNHLLQIFAHYFWKKFLEEAWKKTSL